MKIKNLFLLLLFLLVHTLNARVFFVGSNPHLTVFAFPQDIFLVGSDFAYYYITYQKDPWWGDIDQPALRPNNTYLQTGEQIDEGPDGSSFEHDSYYNMYKNYIGFGREISEKARTRFDLTYLIRSMRNKAEGNYAPDNEVTFDYEEHHSIQELYLRSILALKINDRPLGLMLGLGADYASEPDLDFEFTRNGTLYTPERLIWGWSARSSDIFEASNPVGGGRYQYEYFLGPLFRLDVQAATTFPKIKFGGRFRFRYGILDEYSWFNDAGSSFPELVGTYNKSGTEKIRNYTGRLYGNYNWVTREKWKFNTLVLTRYTYVDSIGVPSGNLSAEAGITEETRNFVFQINPNFNIYPWKNRKCYIDAAVLCNYSYWSYDFLYRKYVNGGYIWDYVSTNGLHKTEDYSHYNFSYAKQNFFELALDINSVLPIFGSKNQNVALGVSLLVWRRFKWMNKYHGGYPNDPATFEVDIIRKNYETETWLNTVINIIYRRGDYTFRLDIGQPLIYNLTPRTRLTGPSGDNTIYELTKESMWVSQSGVRLGFFISTGLKNIFKRRFAEDEEL